MRLSYTQLQTFAQCPRRYVLSRRYEPKAKALPLIEGEVFHAALEGAYARKDSSAGLKAMEFLADEYLSKTPFGKGPVDLRPEKMKIRFALARAVFRAYAEHVFPVDMGRYKVLAVEKPFSIRLGRGLILEGFVDGLWVSCDTGVHFIVEHKYKSFHDEELMPLDLQVSLYTLAMLEEHGLLPTIYNVVLKPNLKPRDGESMEGFEDRAFEAVTREVTGTVTEHEFRSKWFVRRIHSRGRNDLQMVVDQVKAMHRVMQGICRDPSKAWRAVGDHCLCMCPYRPICLEEDPMLVESMYVPASPGRPVRSFRF